jgi:hypothetical protein
MKTIVVLIALLLLAACAREIQTQVVTDDQDELSVSITRSGDFRSGVSKTTMTAQDRKLTVASFDAEGDISHIQERMISAEAWEELEEIVSDIDSLAPEYGTALRGTVADAGIADISIVGERTMRTRIDPDVDDAYPPELARLRQWFDEHSAQQANRDERAAVACTDPRPEQCVQVQDPVCANGRTYSNSCMACADASVAAYSPGEC